MSKAAEGRPTPPPSPFYYINVKSEKTAELEREGRVLPPEDFGRASAREQRNGGRKRLCRNAHAIGVPSPAACGALSVWPLRLG